MAVAVRTSSFRFRDAPLPVHEIGRLLGAQFIVEGSVRRRGDKIRITAQLIEAENGWHLWAERFDRKLEELLETQDQLVRSVAYTVARRLSQEIRETAGRRPPEDWGAYDCFLRGNKLVDGTRQDRAEAIPLFLRAQELDPQFARASTGLAPPARQPRPDAASCFPRPARQSILGMPAGPWRSTPTMPASMRPSLPPACSGATMTAHGRTRSRRSP